MSDNFTTTDASSATVTVAASDDGAAKAAKIVSFRFDSQATYTRPANTTAYSANQAIADSTSSPNPLTFTSVARANAMGGIILDATLVIDEKNATAAEFHLWLFNASPTATNDGSAFAPSTSDSNKCFGPIIFTPANMSDGSNSRLYRAVNLPLVFTCGASTTSIYGLLTTRTGFTPVSGATYQFNLKGIMET